MTVDQVAKQFTSQTAGFDEMARAAFEFQRTDSPIYSRFAGDHVWSDWRNAPYLPVEAFKWEGIVANPKPDVVFASSGTGGRRSLHPVVDVDVYERAVTAHFQTSFGEGPFKIVAHLPTYASNQPSSLLYMMDVLQRRFGSMSSGSSTDDAEFDRMLARTDSEEAPLLIFGTAFGLLDMVRQRTWHLAPEALVVETGGMKTYRRAVTREELHNRLAAGFGIPRPRVWSEYGMCELLSQFYARGNGVFHPPPWVRFKVVDVEDPAVGVPEGGVGLLAVFDLANVYSVSALLTSDVVIQRSNGFEILGRADPAEIRGCNFLMHPVAQQ